ncbi:GH25 family lysozyme [Actinopolymorpha sp. B17G11]|uniref:GH25 family lysozyme n=1 Tax=Actinopolymorpha sp. B17G11 TaxID=3160861 RepID=UPI0032E50F68
MRLFAVEIPRPDRLFRKRPSWKSVAVYVGAAALTAGLAIPTFSVDRSGVDHAADQGGITVTGDSQAGEEGVGSDSESGVSASGDGGDPDAAAGAGVREQDGADISQPDDGTSDSHDGHRGDAGGSDAGERDGGTVTGQAEVDQKALTQQEGSRAGRGDRTDRGTNGRRAGRGDESALAAERNGHQVNMNGWIRVRGIDISSFQPNMDWDYWWRQGMRFSSIKATEGTHFISDTFDEQWEGAGRVGMLRTAYHFALPDGPSGAAQAKFFVANGGGGKADGRTLPGVLDIEFGEAVGRPTCYNLSPEEIVAWTDDFLTTYEKLTGRKAIIYTNGNWWRDCTGDSQAFSDHPLWLASYNPRPGKAPGGWERHTIWQYTDTPLDKNYFKGSWAELKELARR